MGSSYWPYVFIIVLIALSAFFSGSEIAYASANKMRLKKAAESGRAKDKIAYFIYENYADVYKRQVYCIITTSSGSHWSFLAWSARSDTISPKV